ncbi:hypothetical protein M0R45_018024 [Rubus argutus]
MAVWVRFVGLPLRFYKEFPMRKIGHLLGNVVKVDKLTLAQARGQFARVCVEIDLQKPLIPFVDVEGCRYGVVYEGISMICFNCGCFGHVRDNCTFKNPNDTSKTSDSPDSSPSQPSADVSVSMEADSPHPVKKLNISVESQANGHGPWMLMSYKNKKRDSPANGNAQGRAPSGSRFSVLEVTEDGTSGNVDANTEDDMTSKAAVSADNEPKIVSLWKSMQRKMKEKGSDEPQLKNRNDLAETIAGSSSAKGKSSLPMKDITNGKVTGNGSRSVASSSKSRKAGLGLKILKDPGSGAKTFSFPVPDFTPPLKATATSPPLTNTPATFGHCPPENTSVVGFAGGSSSSGSPCNDQASSGFASATFDKAADIPMVVHLLKPSDDEASMLGDMSSSMEENMIVS